MALDTLRELDNDTTRLLIAGASVAADDDALARQLVALRELASKAPALSKVADQVEKVCASKGSHVAAELLNLAAQNTQIRGAQAKLARVDGALLALAATEKIRTPLGSAAIEALLMAFNGESDEPDDEVNAALQNDRIVDLRIVSKLDVLLNAYFDEELVEKIFLRYGKTASRGLIARFNPKGTDSDVQRLKLITLTAGTDAIDFLRRALADGNPEIRAGALGSLFQIAPTEATEYALTYGMTDKSEEVLAEACTIVAKLHNDDRALDSLMDGLHRKSAVWNVSTQLRVLQHPALVPRLLAAYTDELKALGPWRGPKKKTASTGTTAQQKAAKKALQSEEQKHSDTVQFARALIGAMYHSADPQIQALLFERWTNSKELDIKYDAGDALVATTNTQYRASLLEGLGSKNYRESEIAIETLLRDPGSVVQILRPFCTADALADSKRSAVLDDILNALVDTMMDVDDDGVGPITKRLDPALEEVLLPLVAHKKSHIQYKSCEILAAMKSEPAFTALLDRLKTEKNPTDTLSALELFKDKRAVAPICELLARRGKVGTPSYAIASCLKELDDPAAIPAIRDYLRRWEEENAKPVAKKPTKTAKPKAVPSVAKRAKKVVRPWEINELYDTVTHLERAREATTDGK